MSHCRFKFEVRWKSPVRFVHANRHPWHAVASRLVNSAELTSAWSGVATPARVTRLPSGPAQLPHSSRFGSAGDCANRAQRQLGAYCGARAGCAV